MTTTIANIQADQYLIKAAGEAVRQHTWTDEAFCHSLHHEF